MYHQGDRVTIEPIDADPWILHMQQQVTVDSRHAGGGYMVKVGSASDDNTVHGPIPDARLRPGWVEQDGTVRVGMNGRRP